MPVYIPPSQVSSGATTISGGSLTISDEDIVIATNISELNFIGTEVLATNNGDGSVNIDVTFADKITATEVEAISGNLQNQLYNKVSITGDVMTGTLSMSGAGILFVPTVDIPHQEGLVYYDSEEKALTYYNENNDVSVQIGRELIVRIVNKTGSPIPNGSVVFINGSQGNRPTVQLSDADNVRSHDTIGLATHDIPNNLNGYVTVTGLVRDIDTSLYSEGDELYVSKVAGEFTNVIPPYPAHEVKIGTVVTVGVSGSVLVSVETHQDFEELHDINFLDLQLNDFLVYTNGTSGSWGNVSTSEVASVLTPELSASFTRKYLTSFTNSDLSSGILTVTHSLANKYVSVSIYDNTDIQIIPDEITASNNSQVLIDLSSFGILTGTWNIIAIG